MSKSINNKFFLNLKKWIKKMHLWLGLFIGILILIISLTGALYVFKDEIENYNRKEFIYHQEQDVENKEVLPIRSLEKLIDNQVNEKFPLHWVEIPLDKKKSYKFFWYEHNTHAWNYFDEFPVYKLAYVNPYNGQILKIYDEKNGFFNIVKMIHWSFLLKMDWGKYVVGIPVLIYIIMLISGIVLWWPKNKSARKQRIWFRWKKIKNWKRKNYDLHNIFGFYTSIFGLLFAITGLFYSYLLVGQIIYAIFTLGSDPAPNFSNITTQAPIEMRTDQTLDKIIAKVNNLYPNVESFSFDLGHPHIDNHEHPNFQIYVKHLPGVYYKNSLLIFDENSGELLKNYDPEDKNLGEKVIAANYDIHVGSIGGLPTKILAFVVSLLIASMPVTGFLIWKGRKNRKLKS